MATAAPPIPPVAVANRLDTNPPTVSNPQTPVGSGAGDLQNALAVAVPGDTLVCPAGAVYSAVTLPVRSDAGWIKITSSEIASLPAMQRVTNSGAHMFKVVSSGAGNSPAVDIPSTTQGWWIEGMEVTHAAATLQQEGAVRIQGQRTILDRCYIHGINQTANGMVRGILIKEGALNVQVWNSWLSEWQWVENDAQAIYITNCSLVHVENCELQGTGENIMLGDQGAFQAVTDVTLKRNHFFKPLRWRRQINGLPNPIWDGVIGTPNSLWPGGAPWFIKQLFEIKWAKRVLLTGNTLENNWGENQGQDGTAALVSASNHTQSLGTMDLDTMDIHFLSNKWINVPQMFGANTYQSVGPPFVTRIKFENNLGLGISNQLMDFSHQSYDIWLEHNTSVPGDASQFAAGARDAILWQATADWPNQTIRRNIMGGSDFGLYFDSQGSNMTTALANTFVPTRDWAENAVVNKSGQPACDGFTFFGDFAGVDPATGVLAGNSQLKAGTGFTTDGQDCGVNFVTLNAALSGGVTATFSAIQQSGTLIVQFTDTSPSGPITAWLWDFGDSTAPSTSPSPSHTYAIAAPYLVTLTITVGGIPGSTTQTVTVIGAPVASFTAVQAPGTTNVVFTSTSTGGPTSFLWTFGDGTTSAQANTVTHTYPSVTTFSATLSVANPSGSNQTAATPVVLTYGGFLLRQTPTAVTVGAGVTQIQCTFGGVSVGDLLCAFVNRCDAASITGCVDSLGHTYTPWGAALSPNNVGTPLDRAFYAVATAAGANVVVTVTFGAATASFARLLCVSYQPLGTAQIIGSPALAMGNATGPIASGAVSSVGSTRVLHVGYCDYNVTTPTLPTGFTERVMSGRNFLADSLNVTGSSLNYQPTYSGSQNWLAMLASFRAVAPTVTLAADFSWQQAPNTLTVQFTDTSTGTIIGWIWTGTDGFSSTARNPSFTFTSSGLKTVQLTVTDGSNQSTSSHQVFVSGSMTLAAMALTWTGEDLTLTTGTQRRSLLYDSFNR